MPEVRARGPVQQLVELTFRLHHELSPLVQVKLVVVRTETGEGSVEAIKPSGQFLLTGQENSGCLLAGRHVSHSRRSPGSTGWPIVMNVARGPTSVPAPSRMPA